MNRFEAATALQRQVDHLKEQREEWDKKHPYAPTWQITYITDALEMAMEALKSQHHLTEIFSLRKKVEALEKGHCKDCCCAHAWKALGISEYTGLSIPEEITNLKNRAEELESIYKHNFSPTVCERDTCKFCGLNFSDTLHKRVGE